MICPSQCTAAEMFPPWVVRRHHGAVEPTANKIFVIEELLAHKNKAFIIVTNETHRTSADKLVIHNLSLDGSVLIRNHGLATFVHERLEWSLIDQSPEQCACPAVLGQHRLSWPAFSRGIPNASSSALQHSR